MWAKSKYKGVKRDLAFACDKTESSGYMSDKLECQVKDDL